MKRLLAYLFLVQVLTFSLQSWTKADDIRDFQIEGMSIGDSALDYFSKQEIEKNYKDWYQNVPFRYFEFSNLESFKVYDNVGFVTKKSDINYMIYSISAMVFCRNNIKDCHKTRNDIDKQLSQIFKDQKKITNKNIINEKNIIPIQNIYTFKSGDGIVLEIRDWASESEFVDNTVIHLDTKQMRKWLNM